MLIDAHHHLVAKDGYLENLIRECDRLGIDRVCLMALPDYFGFSSNREVEAAFKRFPARVIGFAHAALGKDKPSKLTEYKSRGFKGLKMINPARNYDDKGFYPIYEKAAELGMPILFHTGIVMRDDRAKDRDINSERMRPVYLDTIARAFPELKLIGAHLGNPWWPEAAMAARWNPNLYFDLTGSTLKMTEPKDIGKLLWWSRTSRYRDPLGREAWEKIVFGSDVFSNEIEDVLKDYRKTMDALNVPDSIRKKVFGDTMKELLNLRLT